jgi:uncharacterized protein (DUF2126 family)
MSKGKLFHFFFVVIYRTDLKTGVFLQIFGVPTLFSLGLKKHDGTITLHSRGKRESNAVEIISRLLSPYRVVLCSKSQGQLLGGLCLKKAKFATRWNKFGNCLWILVSSARLLNSLCTDNA